MRDDFRVLTPLFSRIDALMERGEMSVPLDRLTGALCDVARLREKVQRAVAAELLSSDCKNWEILSGAREIDIHAVFPLLPHERVNTLKEMHTIQQKRVNEVLSLVPHTPDDLVYPAHAGVEQIATLQDAVYFGMRSLIEQNKRDPSEPTFAEHGGIVIDSYQRVQLERYLADGNHLLVHRAIESEEKSCLYLTDPHKILF